MIKPILRLLCRRTQVRSEGASVTVRNFYRKVGLPLPEEGERILAENQTNGKTFAGKVIKVDPQKHTFDFTIDLSKEVNGTPAQSGQNGQTSRGASPEVMA